MVGLFEGELDALALEVDTDDGDGDLLVQGEDLGGVCDPAVSHFRDMNKSVLMNAQVNEGSEIRYIGNNAGQYHSDLEVFDSVNGVVKSESFGLCARVA